MMENIEEHKRDKFNNPLCKRTIPDIQNGFYKYVIEIDEEYHFTPEQLKKDKKRENRIKGIGYKIFRIKAYDMNSFNECLKAVRNIRRNEFRKDSKKTILRRNGITL